MVEVAAVAAKATHRVAVGAYLFFAGRMLLLKRAHPPFIYAPPGGKLEPNEDPLVGLRREVREEAALEIELYGVAETWFGSIIAGGAPLLCINYVAGAETDVVTLSHEHTDYRWVTAAELRDGAVPTNDEFRNGYHLRELLNAFELYRRFSA